MTAVALDKLEGLLLGTAVGDALGLPREGLGPRRAERIFGSGLRHRFLFGRGMLSDDTEHTAMLAQAWLACDGDVDRFRRLLARGLRWWLLALPAGVGLGTARAIVKLWLGWPATKSGVRSAGNGPAMRSGLLGLVVPGGDEALRSIVSASTRITHSDPRAERAALLVAVAARLGGRAGPGAVTPDRFLAEARKALPEQDDELEEIFGRIERGAEPGEFGGPGGVSGYAYRSVPAAICAWLRHPGDFRAALTEAVFLGGDADTVGAITGAIAGATMGASGIPGDWVDGIRDYPRSVTWIRSLARRLEKGGPPLPLNRFAILPRNLLFLAIVLAHGFRRLAPPY